MKKSIMFLLLSSTIGCAPAYVVPQNVPTATVNTDHTGAHPSNTSIDIFSHPKCEKQYFLGELADVGTNIDLKKSATGKIEANKVVYFSGTRHWEVADGHLGAWCSVMFSFTPKPDAVYNMKVNGAGYGSCSIDVSEESTKESPKDLQIHKLDRVCRGDSVHFE